MQLINSKAQTLINLKKKIKKSSIPYLNVFKVKDYKKNKFKIINLIQINFKKKFL